MTDDDTHDVENDENDDRNEEKRKVKDLSHTHPHTDEPFGSTGTYGRGGETGGEEDEAETSEETADSPREDDEEKRSTDGGRRRTRERPRRTLADVDHTPPDDVGAQDVYERGREGRNVDGGDRV